MNEFIFFSSKMSFYRGKPFQKKVYEFGAPKQPSIDINSNSIHLFCRKLWETNDMETFTKLLSTVKAIRKSIMRIGSDEPLECDANIIAAITAFDGSPRVLPDELYTVQKFPTDLTLFDSNIWYYMFRAMLPTVEYVKNVETFTVLSTIYKNIVETYITKSYEKFKNEADFFFNKDMRSNHLRKNVQTYDSKELRVKSYHKSFNAYGNLKAKLLNTYYEHIIALGEKSPEAVWKLISLYLTYPVPEVATICMGTATSIKNGFFKERPNFKPETCDAITYNLWIDEIYPKLMRLKSTAYKTDIMERDFMFISTMQKCIQHYRYVPYENNQRVYKMLGLVTAGGDKEILSFLNRITEVNFETIKHAFDAYPNEDIVRIAFENCPSVTYTILYAKLFKYLDVDDNIINEYLPLLNVKLRPEEEGVERIDTEPMIATLYTFGYIATIDEIGKRLTAVNMAEVLMRINDNKKYFGKERWVKTSKELIVNAKRLMKTLTGKYKYVLMNIIDELEAKPEKPADDTSEKPDEKSNNMWSELQS